MKKEYALIQGIAIFAISFHYPIIIFFFILFLCKQIYMAAMKLYFKKKGRLCTVRQTSLKVCNTIVNICLILLLLATNISYLEATLFTGIMTVCTCYSLIKYIILHISMLRDVEPPKKRKPIVLVVAILGLAAYIVIGGILPYTNEPEVSSEYKNAFNVEDFYSDTVSCDRAAIIEDNGDALEERIRLIENAEESIILSTFDICSDTAGKQVIAALKAAAHRGVKVKLLMDGFNFWTHMEGNPYFYALMDEPNIEIRIYNTANPLIPWKGMSRMHDKYIIADENVYLLGGRNTFNYFLGSQKSHKNHDRDVLVYNTGGAESSVYQLLDYFNDIWNMDCCRTWDYGILVTELPCVSKASKELDDIYSKMKAEHSDWFAAVDYTEITVAVDKITLLSNPTDLYAKEPWVFYGLCELMKNADEKVVIHTPYMICNDMMYDSFREICDNDVSVTVMTNSSTNNGNPFGAVDYILNKSKILGTGLNVLEYNGGISYHAKSITIDDNISIVGSFNMDMKSTYQDTELMLVVDSVELNSQLTDIMDTYHQDSDTAVLMEDELDKLFSSDVKASKKVIFFIIKIFDKWLRFLM